MGKDLTCVVAGFGGQGVLFAGKLIANTALVEDREVSWLPSYGPEMRGGTANCSVTLSDKPIGSPLITRPSALIALNQPSFDKFIDNVEEGGIVVVDTAMVPSLTEPEGVTVIGIPATKMCEEAGLKGLGNIVLIGKLWAETGFCSEEALDGTIAKVRDDEGTCVAVVVDYDFCKGCGVCAKVCPVPCIAMVDEHAGENEGAAETAETLDETSPPSGVAGVSGVSTERVPQRREQDLMSCSPKRGLSERIEIPETRTGKGGAA